MAKAQHLIVDSGGFIRNADINTMGENIYSVKEVVTEIRDKPTRQRLAFLPYKIDFKMPSQESVQKVIDAAKKTGDYPSLSSIDIKVMALTYELAKQYDCDSIRDVGPNSKGSIQLGGSKWGNEDLPGFYLPKQEETKDSKDIVRKIEDLSMKDEETVTNEGFVRDSDKKVSLSTDEDIGEEDGERDEECDSDGWITPGNIRKIQEPEENLIVPVACITTDFAMQNVLMKIGLNVFSVDGFLIKTIRSYVLRCHACFQITKIMTKVFCPKCGNDTLKRVPTEVQPDGTVKYFLSKNPKVLSKRGKKISLPTPQGGKHANNPILCEDQPVPQNRVSKKSLLKTSVWSEDYAVDGNPFAINEIESKAFRLGIRQGGRGGRRRGNPNSVNRKFVKRR